MNNSIHFTFNSRVVLENVNEHGDVQWHFGRDLTLDNSQMVDNVK